MHHRDIEHDRPSSKDTPDTTKRGCGATVIDKYNKVKRSTVGGTRMSSATKIVIGTVGGSMLVALAVVAAVVV